jgi:hypothetical protein
MDVIRPFFETSEGAAEEGAAPTYESVAQSNTIAATEPEVSPELTVDAAAEAEPVEDAAPEEPPGWFKQYLDKTDPLLNQLREALEPEPAPAPAPVDLSQLDMTNPEHVAWLVNYQIQQAMQPYEPILGTTAEQQGRDVANKFFDNLEGELGSFDRDQALVQYTALMAENPGAQPEQVLQHAARQTAEYEKGIAARAVEAYKSQIGELAANRNQPAAGASAAVENEAMPTGADKYEIMAARWAANQRPVTP